MVVGFALSPEQEGLKQAARAFATKYLAPLREAIARTPDPLEAALLVKPVYETAVGMGFMKMMVPAPFGGAAESGIDAAIAFEEFCVVAPDFVSAIGGALIALGPVYAAGTPEQIERFVAPFLVDEGAPIAAMAFSEPTGSANFDAPAPADGVLTTAVLDGDEWVITGEKQWASHLGGWDGKGADIMTIVCRTPNGVSVIVAEREQLAAGGFSVEEVIDLPGFRANLTSRVRFDGLRVPRNNLIGAEGQGSALTFAAFTVSAAAVGIMAVGSMRAVFDLAFRFAKTEKRGGAVPIIEHRVVSDVLADCNARIDAIRFLSWKALDAVMTGDAAGMELAASVKVFGSETAVDVINRLIQVIGVQAYDPRNKVLAHMLDAMVYPIFEGSNIGVRRRQLQEIMVAEGWNPLASSGMQ